MLYTYLTPVQILVYICITYIRFYKWILKLRADQKSKKLLILPIYMDFKYIYVQHIYAFDITYIIECFIGCEI